MKKRLLPGSNPYRPMPGLERQFYNVAKRKVFPDDVRNSPNKYTKSFIVWAGIIKQIDISEEEGTQVFQITVEHHYFNWIEDRDAPREMFFLSPRGEGTFIVAWSVSTAQEYPFIRQFAVRDMIIAYGCPSIIEDDIIGFEPTVNIRPIKPQWFSTEVLDYGRSGKPVKSHP
jgi:hypothetical protein